MPRVCLVAREQPAEGGGIGTSVPALAELLAMEHDVTLVTERVERRADPPSIPGVRQVFAQPSCDWHRAGFACGAHAWSAAVLDAIEDAYAGEPGPDLIEAPDYCGEAHVLLQAADTAHPLLADTRIVVRLRGSAELVGLLNDFWPADESGLALYAMERATLAAADCVVVAGGPVGGLYRSYYGEDAVAPEVVVPLPLPTVAPSTDYIAREPQTPLRLLYAGRLERRKGVLDLVEGVLSAPDLAVQLHLVGADTRTAPLDQSMAQVLRSMIGGDDRIHLLGPRPREEVIRLMAAADVVVLPSRFEWWANTAQEAHAAGTPVLATPVGGFLEQIADGETGWFVEGSGAAAIAARLRELADDPAAVDRMRATGACRRLLEQRVDPRRILAGYRRLLETPPRRTRPTRAATTPLTAVIPSRRGSPRLEVAVDSFIDVAGDGSAVVVVADGAPDGPHYQAVRARPSATVIHQRHRGPSAARNAGIAFADSEYVLFLDDDDELLYGFLDRAVGTLAADPTLGYAVPWHLMDAPEHDVGRDGPSGWCPLGAGDAFMEDTNVLGSSCVVVPRWVLDESWARFEPLNPLNQDRELLTVLRRHGFGGAVIPCFGVRSVRRPTGLSNRFLGAHRPAALREIAGRARASEVMWTIR